MSNKRINQILSAAFGDTDGVPGNMNDAERKEFEAMGKLRAGLASLKDVPECQLSSERLRDAIVSQMSAEERRLFAADKVVSEGLDALKAVPEHQLSNERLRNAILGNAVNPRRFNVWTAATVGIACFAIAGLFIVNNAPEQKRDSVAMNTRSSDATVPKGFDNAVTEALPGKVTSTEPLDQETAPAPEVREGEGIDRVPNFEPVAIESPAYQKIDTGSGFGGVVSNMDFDPNGNVTMTLASNNEPIVERGAVVVVDSGSVSRNGAARATEVGAYADVVFGG